MTDISALIPPYVRGFEAYIPSRPDDVLMRDYRAPYLYRFNNNENSLGAPPAARWVVENFPVDRLPIYPSGDAYDLRQALAERLGTGPDQIVVGNGSNEVIAAITKAFCAAGDNIVTADKTFAVYEWVAEFSGFEARLVPLRNHAFDAEGMLARIDARTKIVFVCNPNNPTGTYWTRDELIAFLERVGDSRIVVVDEAYCEFVAQPDYPDATRLIERFPNLVVFRTFSKMYALASLRIGYMVGSSEVMDAVRRTSVAYSVNAIAQAAAEAVLQDDGGHIRRTREMVAAARGLLAPVLAELELESVGHEGNFVMIKVPVSDTLMYRRLMRRGMMVRTMTPFRFPNWIRVTLREHEAMARFAEALRAEIRSIRSGSGNATVDPGRS